MSVRIESPVHMLYDINPIDFADHVRHATSWKDLAVRCGSDGRKNNRIINHMQQKTLSMKLNTEHFRGQNPVPDDVFIKIVMENTCLFQVHKKITSVNGRKTHTNATEQHIKDLDLDTSHWKNKHNIYPKRFKKIDAIDDETFKILLQNSKNWSDFQCKCGFRSAVLRSHLVERINRLDLNTDHLVQEPTKSDQIFVVDSHFKCADEIKKRLTRDFFWPYECAKCKNENFTKCDGVLMWGKQKIVLQLEHINGINNDNRLENLCLLCPNCHSQTSTYCGANSKKHKTAHAWIEDGKTDHKPGSISSLLN